MRRLIVPLLILLLASALERGWLPMPWSLDALARAERALFLIAFLLAWRFRRGRLAAATVVVAAVAEARHLPGGAALLPILAFLLPLHLLAFTWMREWWVGSMAGILRFGMLGLEGATLWFLAGHERQPLTVFETSWRALPWLAVPQPATLVFVVAGILLAIRLGRRRSPLEAGLLGTLLASFLALQKFAAPAALEVTSGATLFFTAAALLLALTPLESAFSLAFDDGLTGLPARRALEENLRHLGRTWAVAMVDIDHFKKLNDRHGHEVGDQVLRMVARELEHLGGGGKAFRYGGEEFTLLFPGCSAEEAADHADELRRRIAGRHFAVRSPLRPKKKPKDKRPPAGVKQLKVQVSVGVAERSERLTTAEQVLKAADKALYRSKKAGRNRVTVGK